MGCGQSADIKNEPLQTEQNKNVSSTNQKVRNVQATQSPKKIDLNKYQMIMMGATKKGQTILALTSNFNIQVLRTKYNFPRYTQALISSQNNYVAYLTGGVQDLQINANQKATIDIQIFEGVISKKFIKVDINALIQDPDDAFQLLPDMNNPRYAHCSIQLNGKLYVIGGRQYGGIQTSILSSCQSFDFKTQKWTNIPSLSMPRSQACCIQFKEHIYLFGGCTGYNTRTRVIETYSSGDTQWRKLPFQLHQGIQSPAVVKSKQSESIIVFGGKTDYGKSNRVFELDFNKSTILGHLNMQQARCCHKIAQNSDQIYIVGGGTQTIEVYNYKDDHTFINYDINYLQFCSTKQMNAFSQLSSQIVLQAKKRKSQPVGYKNKVYLFGHSHEPFTKIIDCQKFVVINDGQSLYHNFYQFTNVVKVNKEHVFIMGGISSDFTEVADTVYSFNLLTQQIKYLQPMKTARYGFTTLVKGSYLYVFGGRKIGSDEVAILNQCERFSFQSYKWESIAPLKTKRHSAFSLIAGDHIVVIGGYKGNGARISDIQIYIEDENRWVELDDKFDLAIQSMCPVVYDEQTYLFGGRNQNNDIQKVFKLKIQVDQGVKYQKSVNLQLQPVGNLSYPGTNLKILTTAAGICYIFGNIDGGIDVYDLKKHKIIQRQQLVVFQKLKDKKFQSYTVVF